MQSDLKINWIKTKNENKINFKINKLKTKKNKKLYFCIWHRKPLVFFVKLIVNLKRKLIVLIYFLLVALIWYLIKPHFKKNMSTWYLHYMKVKVDWFVDKKKSGLICLFKLLNSNCLLAHVKVYLFL